jgi:hypothetical protein
MPFGSRTRTSDGSCGQLATGSSRPPASPNANSRVLWRNARTPLLRPIRRAGGYDTRFAGGGSQVPLPGGKIDGGLFGPDSLPSGVQLVDAVLGIRLMITANDSDRHRRG